MFSFIYIPRLRTLLVGALLVVVGMLLLHPDASAAPNDPALPPPDSERGSAAGQVYTPPAPAAAPAAPTAPGDDPFWRALGIGPVGSQVPEKFLEPDFEWDTEGLVSYVNAAGAGVTDKAAPSMGGDGLIVGINHLTADGTSVNQVVFEQGDSGDYNDMKVAAFTGGINTIGQGLAAGVPTLDVDPVMWLAIQFGTGAQTVTGWTMENAVASTSPDLSASWFTSAWGKSYGFGGVTLILLLAARIGIGVRRGETGEQWVQDMGIAVAGFFIAATAGPFIGQLVINGATAIATNVAGGTRASFQAIIDTLANATASNGSILGGSVIALAILAVSFFGAVAAYIVAHVSSAVTYLSGALFLVAYAWIIWKRYRAAANRVVRMFVVTAFAKPAMFVVMGLAVDIMGSSVTGAASVQQVIGTLVIGAIIMLLAGAAPALVWKYVGSSENDSGPGGGLNMVLMRGGARALRGRR